MDSTMTPFSTKIASEILSDFPKWKDFAKEEPDKGGSTFFLIEVPAPLGSNADHDLIIETENDEVTVSFDYYHSHFDSWHVEVEGREDLAARTFVDGLFEESIFVASWWEGKAWQGSCQTHQGEMPTFGIPRDFDRIRIRSWHGNLNEDQYFPKEKP